MSVFRPQIVDARGRRLALLAPADAEQRHRHREILRRVHATRIWTRRQIAVATLISAPIMLAALAILFFDLAVWLALAAMVPVWGSVLLERHMFAPRYRDACIGAGMCPSCGYDLSAVAVEEDESRVCPECGGAWRVG